MRKGKRAKEAEEAERQNGGMAEWLKCQLAVGSLQLAFGILERIVRLRGC